MTRSLVVVVALSLALVASVQQAAALEGLQPGMKAPAFDLETLDGGRARLAVGPPTRATLVVFWATWSASSAEVLARAEKLLRTYRAQGLAVVAVNVESQTLGTEDRAAVQAAVSRLTPSFPIALDRGLTTFHAYGVVAVPSSVLVGADGTVVAVLAAYPLAGRDDFFELVEGTVLGREMTRKPAPTGPAPNSRAVRYFNLGRGMAARGLWDRAEGDLKKAVEADPDFVLPRVLLGQLYRERAVTRESIRVAGNDVDTLRRSGDEQKDALREAERQLGAAVRVDADNPAALTELAQVYAIKGDTAQARTLLERVARANPDFPPARSHLGALLIGAGDVERGRAELAAAIKLNPLDWRLYITAAEAYEGRGLVRDALDAYRRGVTLLWDAREGLADGGGTAP